jgi:hypothetical protein
LYSATVNCSIYPALHSDLRRSQSRRLVHFLFRSSTSFLVLNVGTRRATIDWQNSNHAEDSLYREMDLVERRSLLFP